MVMYIINFTKLKG